MKTKNIIASALLCALLSFLLPAQTATKTTPAGELRAAQRLEAARKNPLLLRGYMLSFPKGGDLHNHLSGASYAENYIRWGAEMALCVDTHTFTYVSAKKDDGGNLVCADANNQRPAKDVLTDPILYRNVIDVFSMRNFPVGENGEYHFFDTFGKFGAVSGANFGNMLAEIVHRAAYQNEHYVELMVGLDGGIPYQAAAASGTISGNDYMSYREKLSANGLAKAIPAGKKYIDDAEAQMHNQLHCGQSDADIGCTVTVRYIFQVLRAMSRERVFAQTLAGFMMCAGGSTDSDSRVVGFNYVQPEDAYVPMHDFSIQMDALDWLHKQYPNVKATLHAGELTFGQVMPTDLGHHIRESIERGHALRIGHGVDVMYDPHAAELLTRMAKEKIAVEINLSSNAAILGVKGKDHPFPHYLKAGVPVALSTDDEGVSRIDISHEYARAVEEFGLNYAQMKMLSRNALEFSFLAGKSIWQDRTAGKAVKECVVVKSDSCKNYASASDKAKVQLDLEMRFIEFEK